MADLAGKDTLSATASTTTPPPPVQEQAGPDEFADICFVDEPLPDRTVLQVRLQSWPVLRDSALPNSPPYVAYTLEVTVPASPRPARDADADNNADADTDTNEPPTSHIRVISRRYRDFLQLDRDLRRVTSRAPPRCLPSKLLSVFPWPCTGTCAAARPSSTQHKRLIAARARALYTYLDAINSSENPAWRMTMPWLAFLGFGPLEFPGWGDELLSDEGRVQLWLYTTDRLWTDLFEQTAEVIGQIEAMLREFPLTFASSPPPKPASASASATAERGSFRCSLSRPAPFPSIGPLKEYTESRIHKAQYMLGFLSASYSSRFFGGLIGAAEHGRLRALCQSASARCEDAVRDLAALEKVGACPVPADGIDLEDSVFGPAACRRRGLFRQRLSSGGDGGGSAVALSNGIDMEHSLELERKKWPVDLMPLPVRPSGSGSEAGTDSRPVSSSASLFGLAGPTPAPLGGYEPHRAVSVYDER